MKLKQYVIESILDTEGLSWTSAQKYLRERNIDISRTSWCNVRREYNDEARKRLFHNAQKFEALHLRKLNTLKWINAKLFDIIEGNEDTSTKLKAMDMMRNLQFDLADFDYATKWVITNNEKEKENLLRSERQTV